MADYKCESDKVYIYTFALVTVRLSFINYKSDILFCSYAKYDSCKGIAGKGVSRFKLC